jgi:hypothetical protein
VSRLARNSTDRHRLLEISALSDTLILDEDGIYGPAHFNDRLLLGLKGTMSEAQLHIFRHLPSHRLGHRHGETLPRARLVVSTTLLARPTEGRGGVGAA